jgi:LCP family protein required for cell wall assembly
MDSVRRKKINFKNQNQGYHSDYFSAINPNAPDNIEFDNDPSTARISLENNSQTFQKTIHSNIQFKKSLFWLKILVIVISVITSVFIAWGSYFSWKIYAVSQKIIIQNEEEPNSANDIGSIILPIISDKREVLEGESSGRINILLLGAGGGNHPGKNLTDTIMVMSLDTNNKKVALLSLPRDLYVNISETSYYTRINSVYQYGINNDIGIEPIKRTVEEIIGLPLHYFLVMDFEGFERIIDDLRGVNIIVERDIYDPRYPGPNYSYETFEIKKGVHRMDGETALKYVRERHDDPEGDFGRAKRQQQVIQAAKNKFFSLGTLFNPLALNNILNALEKNIKTNIGLNEIERFIRLSRQYDTQNITNVVADAWEKDSLLKVSHVNVGNSRAFILVPRVGNYSEIQDLAQNIFDLDAIKKRRSEIEKEEANILIVNQSEDQKLGLKIKNLFQDKLGFKNVKLENGSLSSRNDTLVFDNTGKNKIFTLDEIIKKLPAIFSRDKNDIIKNKDSDIIVLLGKDLEKNYSFEEDRIEDLNNASNSQADMEIFNQN